MNRLVPFTLTVMALVASTPRFTTTLEMIKKKEKSTTFVWPIRRRRKSISHGGWFSAVRMTLNHHNNSWDSRLDRRSRQPKRGRDFQIRKQPQQSEAFTWENEITWLSRIVCLMQRHWLFLPSYHNWYSLNLSAFQEWTSGNWHQTR